MEELLGSKFARMGFSTRGLSSAGRPVIVRQNDYSIGLFNGDVGLVVPRTLPDGTAGLQVVFPDADQGVRYVAPARLPEHSTVYAMTIHSSQGSEFEHAMVVLPNQISKVVSRADLHRCDPRGQAHDHGGKQSGFGASAYDEAAARIRPEEDFVGSE